MLSRAEVQVNGHQPEPATVEAEPGGVLRVRGPVRGIPGHGGPCRRTSPDLDGHARRRPPGPSPEGLLAASGSFGHRLPELFAGIPAGEAGHAVPYPASCHPQAWSSASAVVIAQAMGVGF